MNNILIYQLLSNSDNRAMHFQNKSDVACDLHFESVDYSLWSTISMQLHLPIIIKNSFVPALDNSGLTDTLGQLLVFH